MPFFELWESWIDAGRFTLEAQSVVALRMMRLAEGGPLAATEVQRMVTEKVAALAAAQMAAGLALASGKSLAAAAKQAALPIRRSVRSNRRRLSRGSS
jgi:hypothetical protein